MIKSSFNNCRVLSCLLKITRDFAVLFVAGTLLTHCYQLKSAKREEAKKIMEATSILITKRMYELQRVNLVLKSNNPKEARKFFNEYREDAIPEWNIYSCIYYQQIERYFGKNFADRLTTCNNKEPRSNAIIIYFKKAADFTENWKTCVEKNIPNQKAIPRTNNCSIEQKNAEINMEKLLRIGTEYIDELNKAFLNKYESYI